MEQDNVMHLSASLKTHPLPSPTRRLGVPSPQNVLYVKNLNVNLLSTNSLTDEGAQVTLDHAGGQIHLANGTLLKISKNSKCGLLELQSDTWQESAMMTSAQPFEGVDEELEPTVKKRVISTEQLWHKHLGHPGQDKAKAIIKRIGNNIITDMDPDTALTSFMALKRIVSFLKTQTGRNLKAIQSNQGTEWHRNEALEWSQDKGIEWQTTVGYNSKQNGKVEWMNRSLSEKMQMLLIHPDYKPSVFWSNLAKFIESKCWIDHIKWKPMDIQAPQTTMSKEDTKNLSYLETDLFDERDQGALNEYTNMGPTIDTEEDQSLRPLMDNSSFGLTATNAKEERNLDPTVQEALAGPDKRFWEEVM
ncbi:hypothetical protein NDA11_002974 [Ustilago hordei]|nr:hypothetical protein NDA10_005663 [Ustilago hordei]KAJ1574024.1 hypothetical protein NDA12_002338 [Ustilago hordei]KAJ1574357.1 hypothetical protein NDA15_000198 [Ustilago hordei]KAJ1580283.1 hypothetical protein NDA11_002974 [Ustilago hordei]